MNTILIDFAAYFTALSFIALPFLFYLFLKKFEKFCEFEKKFDEKWSKIVFDDTESILPMLRIIIMNNHGYIAVGSVATKQVYANAPPAAPPIDYVLDILSALVPPILDDLSEFEFKLKKEEIKKYVIQKLTLKVAANNRSYPLDFSIPSNFNTFEKNIKYCIIRQILPTLSYALKRANKKAQPVMRDAVAAWHRADISLDATLPCNDGKPRTGHDIIPGRTPDPLAILLLQEKVAGEQAILDTLSDDDKERLLSEYDARRRTETGELFECLSSPNNIININKYRHKHQATQKQQATEEPSLFANNKEVHNG